MAKSPRSKLVDEIDRVFSRAVRRRDDVLYNGTCPLCERSPIQCAFHFVRRGYYKTRWDPENVIGACCGCNSKMEWRGEGWAWAWYVQKFGHEQMLSVIARSEGEAKFSMPDLRAILESVKKFAAQFFLS